MSGIVMKHQDGGSYIMDRNGEFHFYKGYEHCPVGTEVIIRKNPIRFLSRAVAAAAVFLMLTTIGSYTYLTNSVLYYAYLDVNPSIEISINRLGNVRSVTGLNDDGEQLVEKLTQKRKLGTVLNDICYVAEEQGYALSDEMALQFTITCKSENKLERLEEWVAAEVATVSLPFENRLVMVCSDEERLEAVNLGISPGKLRMVKEMYALFPEQSMDSLVRMSIADLNKQRQDLGASSLLDGPEVYAATEKPNKLPVVENEPSMSDFEYDELEEESVTLPNRKKLAAEVVITDGAVSLEESAALPQEGQAAEEISGGAESEAASTEAPTKVPVVSETKTREDYGDSDSGNGGGGKKETTAAQTSEEETTEAIEETTTAPDEPIIEETTTAPEETSRGDNQDGDDEDKASDSNAGKGNDDDDDHHHWWDR